MYTQFFSVLLSMGLAGVAFANSNTGEQGRNQLDNTAQASANLAADANANQSRWVTWGPFGPQQYRDRLIPGGGPIAAHAETATAVAPGLTVQAYVGTIDGKITNETDFRPAANALGVALSETPQVPKLGERQMNPAGGDRPVVADNRTNAQHILEIVLADGTTGPTAVMDPAATGINVVTPAVSREQHAGVRCRIHGNVTVAAMRQGTPGLYALFYAVPKQMESFQNQRSNTGESNDSSFGHGGLQSNLNRALQKASPFYATASWIHGIWRNLRGIRG